MWETFYGVWDGFHDWPKSAMVKTMGYSPGLLLNIDRIRTLQNCIEIFMNHLQNSNHCIYKPLGDLLWILGRFPWLTKIRSISPDFGPLKIVSKSSRTTSLSLIIAFTTMWETFYEVWDCFHDWPKSAMFKTMGYSLGLLLNIARFRTLENCIEIFTNHLQNSNHCIYKPLWDVLWILGRFPGLTKIRHVQNHGL